VGHAVDRPAGIRPALGKLREQPGRFRGFGELPPTEAPVETRGIAEEGDAVFLVPVAGVKVQDTVVIVVEEGRSGGGLRRFFHARAGEVGETARPVVEQHGRPQAVVGLFVKHLPRGVLQDRAALRVRFRLFEF